MTLRRAFTIIELLVVVAIIAILMAILIPAIGAVIRHTQTTATRTAIKGLINAMGIYRNHTGRFPWPQTAAGYPRAETFATTQGDATLSLADKLSDRYRGTRDTRTATTAAVARNTGAAAAADGWPVRSSELSNTTIEFTPGVLDWLNRLADYKLDENFLPRGEAIPGHGHRIMRDKWDQHLVYHLADPLAAAGSPRKRVHDEFNRLVRDGTLAKPPIGASQSVNAYPVIYSVGINNQAEAPDATHGGWWTDPKKLVYMEQE